MAVKKEKDIKDGKLHSLYPKKVTPTADVVWFDGKTTESAQKVAESLKHKDLTVSWNFDSQLTITDNYYGYVDEEIYGEAFIVVKENEDDGETTLETFETMEKLLARYKLEE